MLTVGWAEQCDVMVSVVCSGRGEGGREGGSTSQARDQLWWALAAQLTCPLPSVGSPGLLCSAHLQPQSNCQHLPPHSPHTSSHILTCPQMSSHPHILTSSHPNSPYIQLVSCHTQSVINKSRDKRWDHTSSCLIGWKSYLGNLVKWGYVIMLMWCWPVAVDVMEM